MTPPPSQRFVFERNPFFYRIDEKGVQLPYFDRVTFTVVASNLIPAKAGLGESDLQPRYLGLRDYTFLREAREEVRHQGRALGERVGLGGRLLSQHERRPTRPGGSSTATSGSAARCRWRSTARN